MDVGSQGVLTLPMGMGREYRCMEEGSYAQSVDATMNLFVSAAKNALDALALHRTPLQHQDFANALECTHRQFSNSSSILADTYYYLDSATVSSMDSR